MLVAKRYIYHDWNHTKRAFVKKTFTSFDEALAWINRSSGSLKGGAEIIDAETEKVIYEIAHDGNQTDHRKNVEGFKMDDFDYLLLGLIKDGVLTWPKEKEQTEKQKLIEKMQVCCNVMLDNLLILNSMD